MLEDYLVIIKLAVSFLILVLVAIKLFMFKHRGDNVDGKNVCVIVLGDLGRSPRMNYHCLSFANAGYNVSFIGYKGLEILRQKKIKRVD